MPPGKLHKGNACGTQDEDIPLATPILDDQAPERAGTPQIPTYQKAVEDLESSNDPGAQAVRSRLLLLHSILQVDTHLLSCIIVFQGFCGAKPCPGLMDVCNGRRSGY